MELFSGEWRNEWIIGNVPNEGSLYFCAVCRHLQNPNPQERKGWSQNDSSRVNSDQIPPAVELGALELSIIHLYLVGCFQRLRRDIKCLMFLFSIQNVITRSVGDRTWCVNLASHLGDLHSCGCLLSGSTPHLWCNITTSFVVGHRWFI